MTIQHYDYPNAKSVVIDGHPLRRWFYGHFHHSWNAEIDGIFYTMLGIMEMKELR